MCLFLWEKSQAAEVRGTNPAPELSCGSSGTLHIPPATILINTWKMRNKERTSSRGSAGLLKESLSLQLVPTVGNGALYSNTITFCSSQMLPQCVTIDTGIFSFLPRPHWVTGPHYSGTSWICRFRIRGILLIGIVGPSSSEILTTMATSGVYWVAKGRNDIIWSSHLPSALIKYFK